MYGEDQRKIPTAGSYRCAVLSRIGTGKTPWRTRVIISEEETALYPHKAKMKDAFAR